MKLTITPQQFNGCWSRVSGIPQVRSSHDAYKVVLLQTPKDGTLSISAANGAVFGVSQTQCSIERPLERPLILPAEHFAKVAASIDHVATFEQVDANHLRIWTTHWKLDVPTTTQEMFKPTVSNPHKTSIQLESLLAGLKVAKAAIGTADATWNVELALIQFADQAAVVGGDGTHMAMSRLMLSESKAEVGSVKLNAPAIASILDFFSNEEGKVQCHYDLNNMVLYNPESALYVRLSEGRLWNWARAMELAVPPATALVHRESFAEAVRIAAIATDRDDPAHLSIHVLVQDGSIDMEAESSRYGRSESHVPCTVSEGFEPFECRLNAVRFQKALSQFDTTTIDFGLSASGQSVMFRNEITSWILALIGDTP